MAIWVVGAGAIGCMVGARLAVTEDVVFIDGWQEQVNAINAAVELTVMGGALAIRAEVSRLKSPQVDSALTTLAGATGMAAQQKAVHKLENYMYDQVPITNPVAVVRGAVSRRAMPKSETIARPS